MAVALVLVAGACAAQQKEAAPVPFADLGGMYSFLREGEFVQIDWDGERVSGFVSRYGTLESDRGAFLDHFIKTGSLRGRELTFTTGTVHGMWYEFKGKVERGAGKTRTDEAYYVLRGKLTEFTSDASRKISSRSREVEFKSFPQDAEEGAPPARRPPPSAEFLLPF